MRRVVLAAILLLHVAVGWDSTIVFVKVTGTCGYRLSVILSFVSVKEGAQANFAGGSLDPTTNMPIDGIQWERVTSHACQLQAHGKTGYIACMKAKKKERTAAQTMSLKQAMQREGPDATSPDARAPALTVEALSFHSYLEMAGGGQDQPRTLVTMVSHPVERCLRELGRLAAHGALDSSSSPGSNSSAQSLLRHFCANAQWAQLKNVVPSSVVAPEEALQLFRHVLVAERFDESLLILAEDVELDLDDAVKSLSSAPLSPPQPLPLGQLNASISKLNDMDWQLSRLATAGYG